MENPFSSEEMEKGIARRRLKHAVLQHIDPKRDTASGILLDSLWEEGRLRAEVSDDTTA